MKVRELKKNGTMTFDKVKPGDVFRFPVSGAELYMKLQRGDSVGDGRCVNLRTGDLCYTNNSTVACLVECELVELSAAMDVAPF